MFHGGAGCREARVPGKDHGVQPGPRQEDARRVSQGRREAGSADRTPVDLDRTIPGCAQLSETGVDGQNYGDPGADVSQHAARETAVGATGGTGYDSGEHRVE